MVSWLGLGSCCISFLTAWTFCLGSLISVKTNDSSISLTFRFLIEVVQAVWRFCLNTSLILKVTWPRAAEITERKDPFYKVITNWRFISKAGFTHWWPPQKAGKTWMETVAPAAHGKTFWGLRWRHGHPPTDCVPGPDPPLWDNHGNITEQNFMRRGQSTLLYHFLHIGF